MGEWGFWDWVAYSLTWIAAIVSAAGAAIRMEPRLREKIPGPLKANWWGYVPLVLLGIGLVGFLISWLAESRNLVSPRLNMEILIYQDYLHHQVLQFGLDIQKIFLQYNQVT
jgi:hypothetical protein